MIGKRWANICNLGWDWWRRGRKLALNTKMIWIDYWMINKNGKVVVEISPSRWRL